MYTKITPGLILVQRTCLVSLFSGGITIGGNFQCPIIGSSGLLLDRILHPNFFHGFSWLNFGSLRHASSDS